MMKMKNSESEKFYLNTGFYIGLAITIMLIIVSLLTFYQKEWFVSETGNFKVVGSFTVLMSLLMLLKINWARVVLLVMVTLSMLGTILFSFMVDNKYKIALISLGLIFVLVWYILLFSKKLKKYINK